MRPRLSAAGVAALLIGSLVASPASAAPHGVEAVDAFPAGAAAEAVPDIGAVTDNWWCDRFPSWPGCTLVVTTA